MLSTRLCALLLFATGEAEVASVVDAHPAVLSTAWARADQDLAGLFGRAHDAGSKVMHMVSTVPEAERAAAAGADVTVAQGTEGGGRARRWNRPGRGAHARRRSRQAEVAAAISGALAAGNVDEAIVYTGQTVGLIDGIEPAAHVVERIVRDAASLLGERAPSFLR